MFGNGQAVGSPWCHVGVSSMMERNFSQGRAWRCINLVQEQENEVKFIFLLNIIGGIQGDFRVN